MQDEKNTELRDEAIEAVSQLLGADVTSIIDSADNDARREIKGLQAQLTRILAAIEGGHDVWLTDRTPHIGTLSEALTTRSVALRVREHVREAAVCASNAKR